MLEFFKKLITCVARLLDTLEYAVRESESITYRIHNPLVLNDQTTDSISIFNQMTYIRKSNIETFSCLAQIIG